MSCRRRGALMSQAMEQENDDVPQDGHRLRRRSLAGSGWHPRGASRRARRAGRSRSPSGRGSAPRAPRPRPAVRQARDPQHHLGLDFLTRPPLPRQAVDLRQPGQSEPRYSPSDDVTSIDRFSTRPCPLSTSEARSISAWRRAAWRGGKAGLWLGEGGSDVLGQRRLVLLHRQDIITAPFDHALRRHHGA